MSRSLVELYEEQVAHDPGSYPFGLLPTRDEVVASLKSGRAIDVLILGNDLPCAVAAQLLALNGVRVLLITPGPSTPLGTASLVDLIECSHVSLLKSFIKFGALRARSNALVRYAPHRVLTSNVGKAFLAPTLGAKLLERAGVPQLLDDGAIVSEALLAARRDGALVLPYVEPLYLEMVGGSGIRIVGIRDRLSGDTFEVRTGGIVVGHGVSVPGSRLRVGGDGGTPFSGSCIAQFEIVGSPAKERASCSHSLLLEGEQSLQICPLKPGLDALIWKRPTGGYLLTVTLSNSEREVKDVTEEIRRSLGEVIGSVILPKASYFSGDELILGKGVMRIPSSSPLIAFSVGDKLAYLYARSAGKVLNDVVTSKSLINPGALRSLRSGATSPVEQFKKEAERARVITQMIDQAIARWGDRVRYIGDFKDGFCLVGKNVLRGELGIAVLADQVFHVDDLTQSVLRYRVEDHQERESIQSEITTLQSEPSLLLAKGKSKTE